MVFGALRFVLAGLPLVPWLLKSTSAESVRTSALVGSFGAIAYAAIFVSFSYGTTGAKAAFITALQTTVVATLSSMAAKRLNLGTFVSALLAVAGVAVLEFSNGPVEATVGDLMCMAAPILIGLSWHVLGESMKKFPENATPTTAIQIVCFAALFGVWLLGSFERKQASPTQAPSNQLHILHDNPWKELRSHVSAVSRSQSFPPAAPSSPQGSPGRPQGLRRSKPSEALIPTLATFYNLGYCCCYYCCYCCDYDVLNHCCHYVMRLSVIANILIVVFVIVMH